MIEFFSLFLHQFHFLRPLWLLMLLPCLTLVFLLWRQHRDRGSWSRVIAPALLPWLLAGEQQKQARWPLMLVLCGWVIASLALAGPAWQKQPVPISKHQQPWVVAVDLSYHMYAADLSPNRLTRVQFKLQDLFNQRREGLSALVAYAGSAHTVAPLTDDSRTLNNLAKALDPDIMPVQGNDPAAAVHLAKQLLSQGSRRSGHILLVTGSMTKAQAEQISGLLQGSGIRLSILGTGTEQGAPIPLPDGGYLKDRQGAIVVPQLEQSRLQPLARANGGRYQTMTVADTDLQALLSTGNINQLFSEQSSSDREFDQWYDAGYWLVWLLLPAALLGFRRGWLVLIMISLLPVTQDAMALGWNDLWQTRDQQGQKALQEGNPGKAAELFENPAWKAQAQFENQDYQAAADTLKNLDDAESAYNRGNALVKAGKLEEAIDSYQKALDKDPNLSDAAQNLEKAVRDLQEKKREEQQQNQNGNGDGDQKDSNVDQQSSNKDQAGQQQASGDSTESDGQSNSYQHNPDGNSRQNDSKRSEKRQPSVEQLATPSENQQQGQGFQPEEKDSLSPSQQSTRSEAGKVDNKAPETTASAFNEGLDEQPLSPEQQAIESWLRTIPDDPGGLLRRKFLQQQRASQQQNRTEEASW